MEVCQSGFHLQEHQRRLVNVPVEGGLRVILCDFCLSRMMEAQQQREDLTMTVIYQWAKEHGGHDSQLPEKLKTDWKNLCHIIRFVTNQLFKIRTTNVHFPKILLLPNEKDRFVRILEEDEGTIQCTLSKVQNEKERGNIALRLWTGCLCVSKECRHTSVAEHNPDGTVKRESPYTPERRAESFKKIMITSREDPIYTVGMEVAPVWELIENARVDKKMYLGGIPTMKDSPVTKYLKDKNKTIISADDIEIKKIEP
jgi:hypothetical protein